MSRKLRLVFTLIALLLIGANLRSALTTVGPVLDSIRADYHLSAAVASSLITLPLLAFAAVSPVVPAVTRRLGLERTLAASMLLLAAGLIIRSVWGLLWPGTIAIGVGIATLNVALPSLVKRDFAQNIGSVTGAYMATQGVVSSAAAGLAVPLAGAFGWQLALGLWAIPALLGLLSLVPLMRKAPAGANGPGADAAAGADAAGGADAAANGASEADAAGAAASTAKTPSTSRIYRSPLAWQVAGFMALQSVGFYALITYLPAIETHYGIDTATAGFHLMLLNLAGFLGSLTATALIPRMRDQRLHAALAGALFVLSAGWMLFGPAAELAWAVIALAAGYAGGNSIVLALSFFGLRTRTHHEAAALSGMAQSIGYAIAAAGTLAVGMLHDISGSWTPAVALLTVIFVGLTLLGLAAGRSRTL